MTRLPLPHGGGSLFFAGIGLCLLERVSFMSMKKNRIKTAFPCDRHFVLAGFESWP